MDRSDPDVVVDMSGAALGAPDGGRPLLAEGVDWVVRRGEAWLVTGPMNAGKSALLETVAGLRPLAAGSLRFMGQRWEELRGDDLVALRRRVGFVFEGRGRLFPGMTVVENVALPLCYHGNLSLANAAQEVDEWLDEAGLMPMASETAGRLSPAWARRVALVRALVLRPELVLLDDPLAGLDASHGPWWEAFLGRLRHGHPRWKGQGPALLITSGVPRSIPALGSGVRCAVMEAGRWREVGDGRDESTSREPASCGGVPSRDGSASRG
ncbi:MAG: ATP-binding cassette domain-containing protein [Verrucomicrobiota bacterium]|jgi:ABC-type transporter Mla maintaining outer membrane lipid asymmetry ATPase subunit MlaF